MHSPLAVPLVRFQTGHLDEPPELLFPKEDVLWFPNNDWQSPSPRSDSQRITHAPSLLTKDRATSAHLSPEQAAQLGDVAPRRYRAPSLLSY